MNKILGLCNALNMDLTLFSLQSLQVLLMTSSGRRVVIFAVSAFEGFASLSSLTMYYK